MALFLVGNGCVKCCAPYTQILSNVGDKWPLFFIQMSLLFVPRGPADNTSSFMSLLGNDPGAINEIFIWSQFIEMQVVI